MTTRVNSAAYRVYSVGAYVAFLATSLWAGLFLAGVGPLRSVDGPRSGATWTAVLSDLALLLAFAVPHSVMARTGLKRWMRRAVPELLERSTYVWVASLTLALLLWQWRPLPADVWQLEAQPWVLLLWTVYAVGWMVVVASTFMTDHWEFLGLRQAGWLSRRSWSADTLSRRWLYAWVRHPMMSGLLVVFWVTPSMTAGHLLYALGASAYVAIGVHFEERDLHRRFGGAYADYAREVPGVLPRRVPRPAYAPAGQRRLSEPDTSGSHGNVD